MSVLGKVKEESGRLYLSIEDLLEQPKDDKKQVKLCKLNSCMYTHARMHACTHTSMQVCMDTLAHTLAQIVHTLK